MTAKMVVFSASFIAQLTVCGAFVPPLLGLKCDANPKEEELPAMQFMRRPDIDTVARVTMAVQAFLGLGVYGEITRIARFYQVSRLFVYTLLWQLRAL